MYQFVFVSPAEQATQLAAALVEYKTKGVVETTPGTYICPNERLGWSLEHTLNTSDVLSCLRELDDGQWEVSPSKQFTW